MRKGKITESILSRSVIKLIDNRNDKVYKGALPGNDCTVIDAGDRYILTSTQVCLSGDDLGMYYAVCKAANNIRTCNGIPISASVAYILSEDFLEPRLKHMTRMILCACRECNIELAGGHSEITDNALKDMITVTVTGYCMKEDYHDLRTAKDELDICIVGYVALEETANILDKDLDRLSKRLPDRYIDGARMYVPGIVASSSQYKLEGKGAYMGREFADCFANGAIAAHDISTTGVFGALWEMSEAVKRGLEVDVQKIPVRQETVEFCEIVDKNLYQMPSTGSILVLCKDGDALCEKLHTLGYVAENIGKTTKSNNKILKNGEELRYLERV